MERCESFVNCHLQHTRTHTFSLKKIPITFSSLFSAVIEEKVGLEDQE